jgi:endoglucanase
MSPIIARLALKVLLLAAATNLFVAHAQVTTAPAKDDTGSTIAFRRAASLRRGVNLSGWYGGWGNLSPEHIATWTTAADLQFIHSAGLDYVRLGVDPTYLTNGGTDSPSSAAALARLDQSINDILAAHLSVLITIFPRSDYKHALLTPAGEQDYVALWKLLAAHFASLDPKHVFFDLLNEPEIDNDAWNRIQSEVIAAIRAVDTQHTLIATGAHYSSIPDLLQLTPVADSNVIYTFHFYEPYPFTHQGATWGSPEWPLLRDVPYPADPKKLAALIAEATNPRAKNTLTSYAAEHWNKAVIRRRLSQAEAWAHQKHVPLICNEFGAFRDTAPAAQRARYLHDVRSTLESLHIPWAMWDYRGNFGMVTHATDGTIQPDAPILAALGLSIPQTPMP